MNRMEREEKRGSEGLQKLAQSKRALMVYWSCSTTKTSSFAIAV